MDNLKYLEHVVELGKVQAATTPEEMSGAFDAFNGFLGLYYDLAKMELQKAGIDTPPIRNFAIDKALERIDASLQEQYPQIIGVTLNNPTAGQTVTAVNQSALDAVLSLFSELDGTGILEHTASVNVEKEYDMVLQYDDRYEIDLGSTDRLDYKVQYLQAILKELSDFQAGTIDLTLSEANRAKFHPKA